MAAPSKNYTMIADSQVDADSPLDATLLTQLRDNIVHLKEWLGDSYTAAKDHDHDGTNSKEVATIADGAVSTTAKLANGVVTGDKMNKSPLLTGAQSIGANQSWTPAAGVYNIVSDQGLNNPYVVLELYVNGTWQGAGGGAGIGGVVICDGANMRIRNISTSYTATAVYQKF